MVFETLNFYLLLNKSFRLIEIKIKWHVYLIIQFYIL